MPGLEQTSFGQLIHNWIQGRKQRTRIETSFWSAAPQQQIAPLQILLGTLRSDDGDGNENATKQ